VIISRAAGQDGDRPNRCFSAVPSRHRILCLSRGPDEIMNDRGSDPLEHFKVEMAYCLTLSEVFCCGSAVSAVGSQARHLCHINLKML